MPFNSKRFIQDAVEEIKKTIGKEKAIIALSGGVDSFAAAALCAKAIPNQLFAVYVDTGLMRKNETQKVSEAAKNAGIDLSVVNAKDKFIPAFFAASLTFCVSFFLISPVST